MTVRAFVAIELDRTLLAALDACADAMQKAHPPLRLKWVPAGNQHLTLQFLGEIPESDAAVVATALHDAARDVAPFEIALAGTGCFPNATRPNVLWAGVSEPSGALARLQQAVATQLAPLGFEAERGPFQPHLTLARLPRGAHPTARRDVGQWFARQAAPASASMRVAAVRLMRSDLGRDGSRYTPLATIAFSAQGVQSREG